MWDACRSLARPRLEDLAQRIVPCADWDDLVLPDLQKKTLRQLAAQVRHRMKVYETWGFAAKGRRGLGISALFAGASGTGKTMAAEVLARELRLDLYRIDLSAVVSKYIGETEKNLKQVFDARRRGRRRCCSSTRPTRSSASAAKCKDSHDRYANIEVGYLLQRMESLPGPRHPDHQPQVVARHGLPAPAALHGATSRSPTPRSARRSGGGLPGADARRRDWTSTSSRSST